MNSTPPCIESQDPAVLLAKYKLYFECEKCHFNITKLELDIILTCINDALSRCCDERVKLCREKIINSFGVYQQYLFEYLVALSRSQKRRRKRLYILYVINDVLHHLKLQKLIVDRKCSPALSSLFQKAWECVSNRNKLQTLLHLWRNRNYLEPSILDEIWENHGNNNVDDWSKSKQLSLGSFGQPYHHMPASLMMPYIKEEMQTPIDPESIKPMTNIVISSQVKNAMNKFQAFEKGLEAFEWNPLLESKHSDVDALTYYGWSSEFIDINKQSQSTSLSLGNDNDDDALIHKQTRKLTGARLNAYPPPANYD